jgi:hypothetical protein
LISGGTLNEIDFRVLPFQRRIKKSRPEQTSSVAAGSALHQPGLRDIDLKPVRVLGIDLGTTGESQVAANDPWVEKISALYIDEL